MRHCLGKEVRQVKRRKRKADENTIDTVSNVVEFCIPEPDHHADRIRKFTECLGKGIMQMCPEYGLTAPALEAIVHASAIQDIGKLAVPEEILQKPGKLSGQEWEIIKLHTIQGDEMIRNLMYLDDEGIHDVCCDIARHHHERYDGGGYPDGLKGEKISIGAQTVALADVYDALLSKRTYKRAVEPEQAFMMIMAGECGVFSPKLLRVFEKVRKEMEELI